MLMYGDGEGVGLVMTDTNKFSLQISGFLIIILMWTIFKRMWFFKQLLVQKELIFNLWMKLIKSVFDNTFS